MKDTRDLISVIIPVYNVENYLERCIDSVINQSYKNIEILLIDDGSSDKSGIICDKYATKDDRIITIHNKNQGLSKTRNYGIEISKGKFITFIDSDDYIDKDFIKNTYNALIENNVDLGITKLKVSYKNEIPKLRKDNKSKIINSKKALEEMLYTDMYYISTCGKLYRKKLFDDIRFPNNQLFEDVNTTYKLIDQAKKVYCTNNEYYVYFVRNNSITTQNFNNKQLDLIKATEEMTNDIINKYQDLIEGANRRKVYSRISTLCRVITSKGNNEELEKELINYIKENKEVIKYKETPLRDKIAIRCILISKRLFKILWKILKKK